jgi:hypothetical protein
MPIRSRRVGMSSIEREEVVQVINLRSKSGRAQKHDLAEGPFSP